MVGAFRASLAYRAPVVGADGPVGRVDDRDDLLDVVPEDRQGSLEEVDASTGLVARTTVGTSGRSAGGADGMLGTAGRAGP